jgi:hypothetical protein
MGWIECGRVAFRFSKTLERRRFLSDDRGKEAINF